MSTSLDEYLEDKESWISSSFSNAPTPIFDSIFGIILPIVGIIILDPFIFRPSCFGLGTLVAYKNYFYTGVAIEMAVLVLWLIFYHHIKHGLEGIAGIFFMGIAVAFIPIIILILRNVDWFLSLLCLGIVGIIPGMIAFVYLRNGVRALRRARRRNPSHPTRQFLVVLASMLIFTLAVPAFVRWQTPGLFSTSPESSASSSSLCSNYSGNYSNQ